MLKPVKWGAKLIGRIPWVRLAGRLAIGSLLFPFRWTSRFIPKIGWARLAGRLAINSLLFPFSWTSRLIPKIGWAKLAGKLALSSLVTPLRWTAALLPNFAPALARFTAFRIAAIAEMAKVSAASAWHSKLTGSRFSRGLGRFLLRGGAIGTGVALGLGIKPVANGELTPEAEEAMRTQTQDDINSEALAIRAERAAEPHSPPGFLERAGIVSGPAPLTEEQKALPELSPQLQQIELQVRALERIKATMAAGPLPISNHLQSLRDNAEGLRSEITALQGEIDNLGQGPMAATLAMPIQQPLAARQRELQEVGRHSESRWFCSEICAAALGLKSPQRMSPQLLFEVLTWGRPSA